MQKGDEVDVVVVVEIKLVLAEQFSNLTLTTQRNYEQIHYVHILLKTQ